MDISKAHAEPFAQYLDFHDAFNIQFKAGVTAFALSVESTKSDDDTTGTNSRFLDHMDRHWRGGHNWTNAATTLRKAQEEHSRLAIVQIHSAFESFRTSTKAEFDRWVSKGGAAAGPKAPRAKTPKAKTPTTPTTPQSLSVTARTPTTGGANQSDAGDEFDNSSIASKLAGEIGFDTTGIEKLDPILIYFQSIRNCVVHRSSRASHRLAAASSSDELRKLLKTWPKRATGKSPPLPIFTAGARFNIHPKTVITYLDATRRACEIINDLQVAHLGIDGLSYSAAYHVLLREGATLTTAFHKANRAINHALSTRHAVESPHQKPEQALQRMRLWDKCVKRHTQLYHEAVAEGRFSPHRGHPLYKRP